MAKFKVVGIDAAFSGLELMGKDADGIAKMCVYDGAKIVGDAVKKNISSLPVRDPKDNKRGKRVKGVTPDEKTALQKGFGIAKMRSEGDSVNTVLGFDGYDSNITAKYPKGHPISMIARANEVGTSWLVKSPFLKPAYNSSRAAAEAAMSKRFDEELKKRGK